MTTGQRWLLTLEADGGLNLIKQDDPSFPRNVPTSPSSSTTVQETSSDTDRRLHAPSPLNEDA